MSSLQHFGILGMKWGVRRFQNPDGTLTEAGKARVRKAVRYSKNAGQYKKLNETRENTISSVAKRENGSYVVGKGTKVYRYSQTENEDLEGRKYVTFDKRSSYAYAQDLGPYDGGGEISEYELTSDIVMAGENKVLDILSKEYGRRKISNLTYKALGSIGDIGPYTGFGDMTIADLRKEMAETGVDTVNIDLRNLSKRDTDKMAGREEYTRLKNGMDVMRLLFNTEFYDTAKVPRLQKRLVSEGYNAVVDIFDSPDIANALPAIVFNPEKNMIKTGSEVLPKN